MEAATLRATKVARSSLTNHVAFMEQALQDNVTCKYELDDLVKEFEKKAMTLEKAHNAYLNILQDSEIDTGIEEIDTFLLNRQENKIKVISKLQSTSWPSARLGLRPLQTL